MRPLALIFGTLLLVVGAFVAYIKLQAPPPAPVGAAVGPVIATPPVTGNLPPEQAMGAGQNPWAKSYDSKTGNLSTEFRSVDYKPNPDGTVDMTEPEAWFYLGGGQKLYLHGKTGNVFAPNATSGKVDGQSQAPSRGHLKIVTLKLYHLATDAEPQFTCTMDNLAFDNDTFRIATEDCDIPDAAGNLVHTPADQVPVHVRGIDYDFDGRGLLIKWNERDRRLSRLEVAHGESLTIKNPAAFNDTAHLARTAPATLPAESPRSTLPGPLQDGDGPIALVSAAPNAGLDAAARPATRPSTRPVRKHKKPATKPLPPPTSAPVIHRSKDPGIYRATFYDDVVITQAGATLGTADKMNVDFFMNNSDSSTTQPTTRPTTGPTTEPVVGNNTPASAHSPTTRPATAELPARRAKPERTASNAPATSPATQPAPPIIVKWTGKLIVVPPPPDVPPLETGDSILELIGDANTAVLNRNGSVVHCSSFLYHTIDQSITAHYSPATTQPLLQDANGTKIYAPSLAFDGRGEKATIPGPAHAEFPASNEAGSATQPSTRPVQIAKVDWTDICHLDLVKNGEETVIKHAHLVGDVHVDHPQVDLQSEELDLGFDTVTRTTTAPATQPGGVAKSTTSSLLHDLTATGDVICDLRDSQGKLQHITSDTLNLLTERTPRGTNEPSQVTATGDVHAFDDTQDLYADHLVAMLEPTDAVKTPSTTRPTSAIGGDVQLRKLDADTNVHFMTRDGSFADSGELHVTTVKDSTGQPTQEIELIGQPTASVGDRQSTITGPDIQYNPATKQAKVIGAGTMHAVQLAAATTDHPNPTTRPMDIDWKRSFALDGNTNIVDITGGVQARTVSSDGSRNYATGDTIHMTLIDAPPTTAPTTTVSTTAPATQPLKLAATAPSTRASSLAFGGGNNNFLKDKLVNVVTLTAKPDQNVQVKSVLLGPDGRILRDMNLLASTVDYDKPNERFICRVPGRLLVRDNRGQDKAATAPSTTQPSETEGGMKGATAFQWHKDMVYDEHAQQAVMTGNVHIVHESPTAAPYELWADRVVADLDPATKSTTKPAGTPEDEQSFKVKKITATGQVRLFSQRVQFDAAQSVYDPSTQVMTAHGTDREPAHLLDAQGLSTGTFADLVYNTKTEQVELKEFHAFMRKH